MYNIIYLILLPKDTV